MYFYGIILVISLFLYVLLSMSSVTASAQICPKEFKCGNFGNLSFPFSNYSQPNCGLIMANCTNQTSPMVSLHPQIGTWFNLLQTSHENSIRVLDIELHNFLKQQRCRSFNDQIPPTNPPFSISFTIDPNITLIKCFNNNSSINNNQTFKALKRYDICHEFTIYYINPNNGSVFDYWNPKSNCVTITLPMAAHPKESIANESGLFDLLTAEFDLSWHVSEECLACSNTSTNHCTTDRMGRFLCANNDTAKKGKYRLGVIIGSVTGVVFILVSLLCAILVCCYRKKVAKGGSYLRSRGVVKLPSSKSDIEDGSVYCGLSVFTYTELEEITNNFNDSNELGNGGFGTVYYGKLKDGREVAVKYLYEHNFKRMQQFKTEVEILARLRHQNLVTLYGCTSRHSRDLLLVYEYIPNGTIADHLHGNRSTDESLPWPIRMNIAIETADALTYLHASDIIHRDVKSNNILLDNNFCVKVADFGLSRLFPHDVTHISTAPQGTPGYVDPEYHHCYQLTDKSDVYSFGVVLIELISSMPAVDMSRKSHDINLSSYAINRIQRCAFDELIDPSLHIESNPEIEKMTTSVAELAFRCLQNEKEMRPTMEEVAVTLREIQIYEDNIGTTIAKETNQKGDIRSRSSIVNQSPESEEVVLMRKKFNLAPSPTSVADTWNSSLSSTGTSR